ncbi:Deoxyribose-phosphate aldolase 2 [[Eubacterium] contortum]|uniref:Deoxyribose-phosphate aldolase n=1 Tax=Faecalicatena contorta TaxID=39482 RepID=A0A174A9P3_9FIRM|nr:deoxyribose-phosphate aldolase [Faecalicatena contorta]CUN85194.1 Deoxyribose-phosphate aldolase 2 [[Eubacterium] contortum] [Faecalicatena contorta]
MVDLSKIANKEEFAKLFDYNILGRKEATTAELYSALETMKKYKFACFMTGAAMVPIVAEELKDLDCEIGTVIDFPFGYSDTKTKIQATQNAVKLGATSVDMVFNIRVLREHRYDYCLNELKEHVKAAEGAVTKPILEVAFLTDDEIKAGCDIIVEAEATFAKTSTGQSKGPSLEQILVIKKAVEGTNVKVKAGVVFPKPQNSVAFFKAGCDRIGCFEAPMVVDLFDTMREIDIIPPYAG